MAAKSWDQQNMESPAAYRAFCFYRDLPAGERTLKKAYSVFKGEDKAAPPNWVHWSSGYKWRTRVEEYDIHLASSRMLEFQRQHIEEFQEATDRQLRVIHAMQAKLVQRLQMIRPEELDAIATMKELRETIKIERLVMGEPASANESEDGPKVQIVYVDDWRKEIKHGYIEGAARQVEDHRQSGETERSRLLASGSELPLPEAP